MDVKCCGPHNWDLESRMHRCFARSSSAVFRLFSPLYRISGCQTPYRFSHICRRCCLRRASALLGAAQLLRWRDGSYPYSPLHWKKLAQSIWWSRGALRSRWKTECATRNPKCAAAMTANPPAVLLLRTQPSAEPPLHVKSSYSSPSIIAAPLPIPFHPHPFLLNPPTILPSYHSKK